MAMGSKRHVLRATLRKRDDLCNHATLEQSGSWHLRITGTQLFSGAWTDDSWATADRRIQASGLGRQTPNGRSPYAGALAKNVARTTGAIHPTLGQTRLGPMDGQTRSNR